MTDFSEADEYLDKYEEDIETEYGMPYKELTKDEQQEAILDIFFQGIPAYRQDAEHLREGINYARQTGETEFDTVKIRGHNHRVVRDNKGRFNRWLD